MAQQSFMWTALPNGYTSLDRKSLRLSVILSPRLDAQNEPQLLSSFFPDWEDWPTTLGKATFKIMYGNKKIVEVPAIQTTGTNRIDTSIGFPDTSIWKALFTGGLFVRGFEFKDLSQSRVLSYDTQFLSSEIQNLYKNIAQNANGNLPRISNILDNPYWAHLVNVVKDIDIFKANMLQEPNDYHNSFFRNIESHDIEKTNSGGSERIMGHELLETLARFELFHSPPTRPFFTPMSPRQDDPRIRNQWLEYTRSEMPKREEFARQLDPLHMPKSEDLTNQIDFHQIITAMNQYPTMLRMLGIVVDFVLDATLFDKASDEILTVEVDFPPGTFTVTRTPDTSLKTHVLLTTEKFQAVSSPDLKKGTDARVIDGLLETNQGQFDLLQFDVDGAGLKLMNFARSLAKLIPLNERIDTVTRFEKEIGVPTLRTAGFMLVQNNRGSSLENRFKKNKDKNTAAEGVFKRLDTTVESPTLDPKHLELWAEDIVRGHRIDIWDSKTGIWRSLCQREATYYIDGREVVREKPEEGTVRLAATTSPVPDKDPAKNIVSLHEALVSWTGWSLVAPPPGRAITNETDKDKLVDKSTAQTEAELPPGVNFKTRFNALPGSLPRLRFGRKYRIRARVVDLAGNSLPVQKEDFGFETPLDNAPLYSRYEPLAPPVIALVRSPVGVTDKPAEGESMGRIAIRSFNDSPEKNAINTTQSASRFAVPPQSSVKDAEAHGRMDTTGGGDVDRSMFDMLANQKDRDATDVENASLVEEVIPTRGPIDPTPVNTTYAVYKDGHEMTYLPDPIAERVAVRIFDHPNIDDTEVIDIPLYPTGLWPNAQPFKILLFEGHGDKPIYDKITHTLLVPLPKAVQAKIRLSMQISAKWLEMMGVWNWLSPADQANLKDHAKKGQHWMITPWRTLDVVHAVQQPLVSPQMLDVVIDRNGTSAYPRFVATCSIKSTDILDLLSEWHEPDDTFTGKNAVSSEKIQADILRGDVAFSTKITDPKSYLKRIDADDKGGSYPEYEVLEEDLIWVNLGNQHSDFNAQRFHEFHDTRYRRIEYWLEATTKFREYMPAKILTETREDGKIEPTDKNIKIRGSRTVTWIPNSAPPPAPEVLYVVPTFGWFRSRDDMGDPYSWRRGGGLRVYLNRPWNVSGYGEMLGVVLAPDSFKDDPEDHPIGFPYKNYVTQWGSDPTWVSFPVNGIGPRQTDFLLARTAPDPNGSWLPKGAPQDEKDQPQGAFKVTGLRLPGNLPFNAVVDVAPHDVFYDEERRLWYCDIEIAESSSYYPFIRLALARYQPVSLYGTYLSDIVLADFMQLTTDRWLNVTRMADVMKRHVAIYGNKHFDSSGSFEAKNTTSTGNGTGAISPVDISGKSVFEVWVEILTENNASDEDFGWGPVNAMVQPLPNPRDIGGDIDVLWKKKARARELLSKGQVDVLIQEKLMESVFLFAPIWEGDVTLIGAPEANARYRLVIAEYEEYLADDERPYDGVPQNKDRRIVFVEHVEMTF